MENISEERKEAEQKEQTVELPVLTYFGLNMLSFVIPLYPCMGLFLLYLFITNILSVEIIWMFLFIPSLFLLLLYIYIILLIEFAAILVRRWNKKSPAQEGVFPRMFIDKETPETRLIKYYHLRGFIIKFPVWLSGKSPFPWLLNRALRRIGHNKIGKNVIMEDVFVGLEFTDIQDNVFMYPSTAVSSHSVNSIFGWLNMFVVKINENSVIYPGNISGCGALIDKNYVIFPNTVIHKHWKGRPNELFYQGSPGKPLTGTYKGIEEIEN